MTDTPVTLHVSEAVLEALRRDVFNGRVWPNFLEMSHEGRRFITVNTIAAGQVVEVEGLRITPVPVNHVLPTLGVIIEDANAAVVITSDTAATTEIWERASATPNLKAVFLEATLPNELESLAEVTKHLTAAGFIAEMRKLTQPAKFYAVHLSARAKAEVTAELRAHRLPNVEIAQPGKLYEF